MSEDEHSRGDELLVQMIGLEGKIDRLKREKQELIEKILKELGKVLINEINMKDGDLILVDIIKNLEEMKNE